MYLTSVPASVPDVRGIYGFYRAVPGIRNPCAYVGSAGNPGKSKAAGLRTRLKQHFVEESSTICATRNAASINLERVTEVRYWTSAAIFTSLDLVQAGELILMDQETPLLWSKSNIPAAVTLLAAEPTFLAAVTALITAPPQGVVRLPNPDNMRADIAELLGTAASQSKELARLREAVEDLQDPG